MSSLFELHVEHILTKVFLLLDSRSLAQAKQVCRAWNRFIREELWARRHVR